jgi:hypothetical protein
LTHWWKAGTAAVAVLALAAAGLTPPVEALSVQTPLTFDRPGTYSFTVPNGVFGLGLDVYGAQGGDGGKGSVGGRGGRAEVKVSTRPGDTYSVVVGGRGDRGPADGGSNGGGASRGASYWEEEAGSGGGATEVRRSDGSPVVVAGGGGGGGGCTGAGVPGGTGGGLDGGIGHGGEAPGKGGSQKAGGSGGRSARWGDDGRRGLGGSGGPPQNNLVGSGGGGGGGYYGGGGGGGGNFFGGGAVCFGGTQDGGGGGGGSGFGPRSVLFHSGVRGGAGLAVITFLPAVPTVALRVQLDRPTPSTMPAVSWFIFVTALDANGDRNTGYRGTVRFTTSVRNMTLPTDYTFTARDNGTRVFSGSANVRVFTSADFKFTVSDTQDPALQTTATVPIRPSNPTPGP